MRTKNSIKNIYIKILTQVVITLLGFISRKVFIDNLGTEYLGVNGLLTNVISMLALVEGGIGTSITYNLYKPLAENNKVKIIALVQLYKKLYGILAIAMLILSIVIYPFIGRIIFNTSDIPFIGIVYFIFILKNMVSYLNAHKWSLIYADQKGYMLDKYNLLFNILITIGKIAILTTTQNYILYLIVEIIIFLIKNIFNGYVVNKNYRYIKTNKKYEVEADIKENITGNVKALFLHNVGSYCVFGTDNLLISTFINIKVVGLYSNYTMIISQLAALLTPILGGVGASIGNLIAVENNQKKYDVFKVVYLVNFWIYSFSVIFLYNLIDPFIEWWLGDGLLLDRVTLTIILINFYITGMRGSINTFKSKSGIFKDDKFVPLIESVINLGASIILVNYFGLAGIFLGTTISTIAMPMWIQSKLVYNKVFNKSVVEYFNKYILYCLITIVTGYLTTVICNNIVVSEGIVELILKGLICVFIPNTIYLIIFFKSNEVQYLINILKGALKVKV